MPKLALNFICKNESKLINHMLSCALPIVDLIVVNDTGSADGTQKIIRDFGTKHQIPTYIFERPFDDFAQSRNFAMEKLREVVDILGWRKDDTWGFWFDCDETLVITSGFKKESISFDIYNIVTKDGDIKYFKSFFFRLSIDCFWESPIHETIVCRSENTSFGGLVKGLHIIWETKGHSWRGDITEKYRRYGLTMEKHLNESDHSPRSVYYTAQCFLSAALHATAPSDRDALFKKSLAYFTERLAIDGGDPEERYISQLSIGQINQELDESWSKVESELLKAYQMDHLRGDSFYFIIDHYISTGDWPMAYFFSQTARERYHTRNPFGKRFLLINESIYNWRFLYCYYYSAFHFGDKDAAKSAYKELQDLILSKKEIFSKQDLHLIFSHSPFLQGLRNRIKHTTLALGWRK